MDRKEYEMTQEQLDAILDASKPTVAIMIGSYMPPSPQENANRAWQLLANEMNFELMSVQPVGTDQRKFTAIPMED